MVIQEREHESPRELVHRRSTLDIYLDVLRAVKTGARKPTRIMYAVNMSWAPIQKTLSSLVSTGFIREIESKEDKRTRRQYEITESGLNVLNYLERGKDVLRLIEATHSA